ncbi:PAS domain S-box protein [Saccharopolyspora indica]|uniref:sensor domain-containing diguanylate cyclase n=1 Tax=Saccharopolyspora indica TaxID=1229659 RepID=UPI0022EB72A8|nr:sensor domain-containing diguanylate cyclase [Saccharopolyspora indica]MDA3644193.1 PAS domain S-box protein [Saccharopolyspora indica]
MSEHDSATPDGLAWRTVLHQAAGPVSVLDLRGRIAYVNPALCDLLACGPDDLLGRAAQELTHPDDPAVDAAFIQDMITNPDHKRSAAKRAVRSDGAAVWLLSNYALIRDANGEPLFVLTQHQDITERHEVELRWRQTFANAPIGMALVDLTGRWTEVNDNLCEMVGYTRAEMLTKRFTDLTYPDQSGMDLFNELVSGRQDTASIEKRFRHKAGHPIWILVRASVVRGADAEPAYLVAQYEAIGERESRDRHLAHMALHDPLTGLANRALLMDRLHQELAVLPRRGGVLAVLLADVNGLKPINDSYGHAAGDQLLITAADELLKAVRPGDTVARLGGDEFVVLTRTSSRHEAEGFRDVVAQRLETTVVLAGHETRLSASVGLATADGTGMTSSELLHRADLDMYAHKAESRR